MNVARSLLAITAADVAFMIAAPEIANHARQVWWLLLATNLTLAALGALLLWRARKATTDEG